MKKLKHIGEGYHGGSPDETLVFAMNGDVVEVCDEKAVQLFSDFPKEWVLVEEKKEPVSYSKTGKK